LGNGFGGGSGTDHVVDRLMAEFAGCIMAEFAGGLKFEEKLDIAVELAVGGIGCGYFGTTAKSS
jgi:hypothetical protein